MKSKTEKRTEAKKNAEALKAKRKDVREKKGQTTPPVSTGKKGKSSVPQAKKK